MNTAVNVNVVHESEAQRQHARVRLPAKLRYIGANRETLEAKIEDLSAGGICFLAKQPLKVGEVHRGRLQFMIDNLGLAMDIEFQVRSFNPANGRAGCQFQNLEPRDIATLRHLITSHLSGELVTMGDVLSTLQRDNFTKARKQKDGNGGMTPFARLKAVFLSLGVFVVGVAAFGFIAKSVYGVYFVSHAEAGVVSVPIMNVTMPRDGTVQSLVEVNGQAAKGAPLASFSTSMLDVLKGHLDDQQLEPGKVEALFGKQMSGTLTSPCECIVSRQLVDNGQYASKGTVIFQLLPRNGEATVEARFSYRQFDQIKPGTRVDFQVAGEDDVRQGEIVNSTSLNSADLSSDIRVQIKPDAALPSELAGRPVAVNSDRGPSMNWLIDKAVARGL
ncbi:alginate biosynthesis protein Alg44 [Pseudomonas sp. R5(2019)]|uniref:alginate biosynthesis protein Alg44 n=1 Tax=Pseudomonas sp. R5(2019) TaxID=2697566 RepID=UPI001411CB86|nr:alginate biosynthesis protein Alg44 [Pseudomonas sp. R5(2019)]NBA98072.1 HlyD family efflux transporter periplasmic adaptor subunit [Pseudomonas sp. R5(2019)]